MLRIEHIEEPTERMEQTALRDIDTYLKTFGRDEGLAEFETMPQLNNENISNVNETNNFDEYKKAADDTYEKSNNEQKSILQCLYNKIEGKSSFNNKLHFIDAPAGT